jgi:hypothetical protein
MKKLTDVERHRKTPTWTVSLEIKTKGKLRFRNGFNSENYVQLGRHLLFGRTKLSKGKVSEMWR